MKSFDEIKKAVDAGRTIYWKSLAYQVIKNSKGGEYLIKCTMNGSCVGLHEPSYNPDDFFSGLIIVDVFIEDTTEGPVDVNISNVGEDIDIQCFFLSEPKSAHISINPEWFKNEPSEEIWDKNWEEIEKNISKEYQSETTTHFKMHVKK